MKHKDRFQSNFDETHKPPIDKLIYWIGPSGKDILGWYRGGTTFEEVEKQFPGFLPRWWYEADEELSLTIEDPKYPKPVEPKKPGRKPNKEKKVVKEKKEKTKKKVEKAVKTPKKEKKPKINDDFLDFF